MKQTADVEVSIVRRGCYRVGGLTRGWSAKERAALDAHDPEAIDALREAAAAELKRNPADTEMFFEIIE